MAGFPHRMCDGIEISWGKVLCPKPNSYHLRFISVITVDHPNNVSVVLGRMSPPCFHGADSWYEDDGKFQLSYCISVLIIIIEPISGS